MAFIRKKQSRKNFTQFIKRKCRASSLVEVLVAIVVCMIVFTLSMTILLKADQGSNPIIKLRANFIYSHNREQLLENIDHLTGMDTLTIDGINICRTVEPVDSLTNVLGVTFRVFDKNQIPLFVDKVLISNNLNEDNAEHSR